MVQIIPPKPAGGLSRFVEGLNTSLSQSLPKYIEQGMLSQGLKNLSAKQDLTPQQYYHELLSIPGVANHPAIIESAQKLAREQMNRQGLSRRAGRQNEGIGIVTKPLPGQSIQDVNFGSKSTRMPYSESLNETPQGSSPQKVKLEVSPEPAFREKSPLSPGQAPFQPWSEKQRNIVADDLQSDYPYMTREQALNEATQLEAREKGQYEAAREAQQEKRTITKELGQDLLKSITTKLQKANLSDVYKDLSGDFLEKVSEKARKDLLYNPNLSEEEAVQKWSNKALEHAKNVKEIDKIASDAGWPETKLKKLQSLQKLFTDNDSLQDFKNLLQAKFDFSPQYAAKIAHPRSKSVSQYISKIKSTNNPDKMSLKAAEDISRMIGEDDSPLAIASSLKYRVQNFNEGLFFSYLRDHMDELPLKEWQKRELVEGEKSLAPSWGDFWYSPWVGRSVIND